MIRQTRQKILQVLEKDYSKNNEITYSNMCELSFMKQQQLCQRSKESSYAEMVFKNLNRFKLLQNHIISNKTKGIHFYKSKVIQLYEFIPLLNLFTRLQSQNSIDNFKVEKHNPSIYLNLIIVQMIIMIIVLNYFTYFHVYRKMKIYYQEAFSLWTIKQMKNTPYFYSYANRALQEKIGHIFDKQEENDD